MWLKKTERLDQISGGQDRKTIISGVTTPLERTLLSAISLLYEDPFTY